MRWRSAKRALAQRLKQSGLLDRGEGLEGGEGAESQVGTLAAEEDGEEVPGGGKPFKWINSQVHIIEGDECVTEEDEKGSTRIDQYENLLRGAFLHLSPQSHVLTAITGRVFKGGTFILPQRHPEWRHMLAIDAARTFGFCDSLYCYYKDLLAYKLNATQAEKDMLIEHGKLGSHLRTRSVTLITARSAYRLYCVKMVLGERIV